MFSFRASNFFCLIPAAIFALNDAASANTCTDAMYKIFVAQKTYAYPESKFQIDSVYTYEYWYESANKEEYKSETIQNHIINDGKLEQITIEEKAKTTNQYNPDLSEERLDQNTTYFYHDTNETVLKSVERELIISDCKTNDNLCYIQNAYHKGKKLGEIKTKINESNNYTGIEICAYSSTDNNEYPKALTEYFLKKDTVIEQETAYYNADSVQPNIPKKYVADPTDDLKCYRIVEVYSVSGKDTIHYEYQADETYIYRPYAKGFSIKKYYKNESSVDKEERYTETFVIDSKAKTSIRKTVKPVKIAPKARYFDLLGRYKFSK